MSQNHQFYLYQWRFLVQHNISIKTRKKKTLNLSILRVVTHIRTLSRRQCRLVSCSIIWWCICCWAFAAMLRFHFRSERNDEVKVILLPKTVELSFFKWKRHSSNAVTQGMRPSCTPTHMRYHEESLIDKRDKLAFSGH